MIAEQVKVKPQGNWPDYVFTPLYNMPTLPELERYIEINKHLPEVPNAIDVKRDGLDIGEINTILLKKVEELTIYLIEQNKKLLKQDEMIQRLLKKDAQRDMK